ncbi:S9 family peptidase [Geothrix sp. PMB-07]|uniref:S9 family peptidase n=1 Tax=Geothrix sp. PMB-07 TaxID=3068640 RepID=UPI002741BEB8|nr:S9 family peptidase [Geothrix sp. PMB-07]WLT30042.1 S9 family peptidase [Geothrix sp. PMB-07]
MSIRTLRFAGLAALVSVTLRLAAQAPVPPVAKQVEHLSTWHGEKVNDPWFWLREKANPEVVAYLNAENSYMEAMTADLKPFSEALYKEILGRIKQTDLSVPVRRGAYHYYSRTEEGKQYGIQCRRKATNSGAYDEKALEEVLLDQNELAKGLKFLSLGGLSVSDDDKTLLYSTDATGFRQYTLFTKDLGTGKISAPLAERVTSFTWAADNRHVFFVTEDAVTKRSNQLWRLDLKAGKPELVFEEKDELYGVGVGRTKDHKYLVSASQSTDTWEMRYLAANDPKGAFKAVLPREKGHKYDLEHREGLFYLRTNRGAKNFRLVSAPVATPDPAHWSEVLPHRPDVLLDGFDPFKDFFVVAEKSQGLERFRIFDVKAKTWRDVSFPESVYSAFDAGTPEYTSTTFRLNYQSMVTPSSIYDCDMATGKQTLLKQTEVLGGYDKSQYATERLWATARDGVKVPLSVVYKKGVKRDGSAPLFLYAYGSYGYGQSATFSIPRLSLLDRGMVYVLAHIRGGNDMGEAWHDDGMLMKKMNTFTDFIDSADFLVKEKWTSKDRLVIEGGSAGGLLMGAVTNLRPDLFKAVHSAVPFVDVMNTMMDASLPLTVGEYLEWGNPNEKAAFDYMRAYSPYDNLQKKAYPAILVTTSFNDSQVMYWEPAKYVAKLRTLKTDSNPLLLKIKMEPAGHGGASGRYDALKDKAFETAWMLSQVGIIK